MLNPCRKESESPARNMSMSVYELMDPIWGYNLDCNSPSEATLYNITTIYNAQQGGDIVTFTGAASLDMIFTIN